MEIGGSDCGEVDVGVMLCVDLETTFQGGFVVSFTDSEGTEYRGALLRQKPPFSMTPGCSGSYKYDLTDTSQCCTKFHRAEHACKLCMQ